MDICGIAVFDHQGTQREYSPKKLIIGKTLKL